MQSLDNILKPIGDRFNSPLYSTFLISWCVSNWKIFYVTFIMSAHELSASKLDYIEFYIKDHLHMFVYPLGFTVIFIYAFPIIEKEVLKLWYENKAERKQIVVEEMEKSPVSGEEYRKLLMRYVEREDRLNIFFEKERQWVEEKIKLTSDHESNKQKLTEVENQNREYSYRTDAKYFLKGTWSYKYRKADDEKNPYKEFNFYVGTQDIVYKENDTRPLYKIIYFFYDSVNKRVYLLKEHEAGPLKVFLFNQLSEIRKGYYQGLEFGIDSSESEKPEYVVYDVVYSSITDVSNN